MTKKSKRKLSKEHKEKISRSLKKYHKTCKKSRSKSKSLTDKSLDEFLAGIKSDSNKKNNFKKEIEKLKKMIK